MVVVVLAAVPALLTRLVVHSEVLTGRYLVMIVGGGALEKERRHQVYSSGCLQSWYT